MTVFTKNFLNSAQQSPLLIILSLQISAGCSAIVSQFHFSVYLNFPSSSSWQGGYHCKDFSRLSPKCFISSNLTNKTKRVNNPNLYDKISPAAEVSFCHGPEKYLVSINSKNEQERRLSSQKKIGLNINRLLVWLLGICLC